MDIFIYPAHTELTIIGYPLSQTQFSPMICIYPVERFSGLLPEALPPRVSALERIISSGELNGRELPFLPPMPLTQAFHSNESVIAFNGGQGVRFITQYNEFDNVISNRTIFYTFQGLSEDGKYWVAVSLPVSNPSLPASDYLYPPEGYTHESWSQNYDSYLSQVKEMLAAQAAKSFFPTIGTLDSLVESMTVQP